MITLYTGTPGSGKSLDVARKIYDTCLTNKKIICNFDINKKLLKRKADNFLYLENEKITPSFLYSYSRENCVKGKENQVLLVIDEAQMLFNSRDWNKGDRAEWCKFFQLHRHYGYNIILATQFDRLLDRQIRSLVEYEIIHRKINNYGLAGALIGLFLGARPIFIRIEYWYPIKEKISVSFFRGRKKLYNLYDSYLNYEELNDKKEDSITNSKIIEKEDIKNNDNLLEFKTNLGDFVCYADSEDDDFLYVQI